MEQKLNALEGDEAVEIDASTSYEDWLFEQGLQVQDFEVKVKVEDLTDDEDKGSSTIMTEQKTEEISDENKSENKSDGKIDDSNEIDIKEDKVSDVKQLDTLKLKVQDIIDKGETKEQSEHKIQRLKMILNLLNEEEENESGNSKVKAEDVKPSDGSDGSSKEVKAKEENTQKEVQIRKIENKGEADVANEENDKATVHNKFEDGQVDGAVAEGNKSLNVVAEGNSPLKVNQSPEKIVPVLSICKIDKSDGKCNMDSIVDKCSPICSPIAKSNIKPADVQNEGDDPIVETFSHESDAPIRKIQGEGDGDVSVSSVATESNEDKKDEKTKRVSFVLPKETEENLQSLSDTDTDLVIDLEKCYTALETLDSTESNTVGNVESKENEDTEETVELKEHSSDTLHMDDIDLPDDDNEPFPLSQNVHRARYVKSDADTQPVSDSDHNIEHKWDKLEKGQKLKR